MLFSSYQQDVDMIRRAALREDHARRKQQDRQVAAPAYKPDADADTPAKVIDQLQSGGAGER